MAVQKDRDTDPPLNVVGVLNTIPEFYKNQDEGITGLNEPPFLDAQRTQPNPANPWAYFVFTTVSRYSNDVTAWQVGNEPPGKEFPLQWPEYTQALSVACEVISVTDPDATVLLASPFFDEALATVGGAEGWLYEVLIAVQENPNLRQCVSAMGLHSFGRARHPYYLIIVLESLVERGFRAFPSG